MQQKGYVADSAAAIAQYFEKPCFLPSRRRWAVVVEILSDGRNLNRKSLCTKLLQPPRKRPMARKRKKHYHKLLGLLFER